MSVIKCYRRQKDNALFHSGIDIITTFWKDDHIEIRRMLIFGNAFRPNTTKLVSNIPLPIDISNDIRRRHGHPCERSKIYVRILRSDMNPYQLLDSHLPKLSSCHLLPEEGILSATQRWQRPIDELVEVYRTVYPPCTNQTIRKVDYTWEWL